MSETNRQEVGKSVQPSSDDQEAKARQITRFQRPSEAYIASRIRHSYDAHIVWDRIVMKWLSGGFKNYDMSQPFRPYLLTVLTHEINRFFREEARNRKCASLDEAAIASQEAEAEKVFDCEWGKMTLHWGC